MSGIWTAPFFSAAANFSWGEGFRINEADCWHFKYLSVPEKNAYRFKTAESLINYNHNPIGYVYFIISAKKIFFWQGDITATESLQILIHLLISAWLLWAARSWIEFVAYFFLYAANPLIIYFVTFPFYYNLQAIPGVLIAMCLLRRQHISLAGLLAAALLLAFVFTARSTILFACVLLFLVTALQKKWVYAALMACVFLLAVPIIKTKTKKNPWHTIYIGIGGYPNPYLQGLTDDNGYLIFKQRTGTELNVSFGGNYYDDRTIDRYTEITKKAYVRILRQSPLLILRNATLNFFQSFSMGYFVDYPLWVSYLSAFVGLVFFACLLIRKMYWWVAAIALSGLSFTPYFPPIQAYMFGSYVLIVAAFVELVLKTPFGQRLHQHTLFEKPFSHEANHPVV